MAMKFAEELKTMTLLAPVAIGASVVQSAYVKVNQAHWASFIVPVGAFSSSNDTCTVQLTVECSTANTSNATETAIAFKYRLSAAVGADTWGTITATTSTTGVAIRSETDENCTYLLEVNPSALPAALADGMYLRCVFTPGASGAASDVVGVISVIGVLEPRYPGNTIPSAT